MKSLVVIVVLLASPDNLEKNYYPVDTEDNCAVDDKLVIGHYCNVK